MVFFGKERTGGDVPGSLSYPPTNRKPWEVAAYFNLPFKIIDKNFISSLILYLYKRRIIDIKVEKKFLGKNCYIKVLKQEISLDKVESKFLEIILRAKEWYSGKYSEECYVNLNRVSWTKKKAIVREFKSLLDIVKRKGKEYLSNAAVFILLLSLFFIILRNFYPEERLYYVPIAAILLGIILDRKTSVFIRYKKDYFQEYKHWQAFKSYLNGAPSLKSHGHKEVILWRII